MKIICVDKISSQDFSYDLLYAAGCTCTCTCSCTCTTCG